jgi:protease-4
MDISISSMVLSLLAAPARLGVGLVRRVQLRGRVVVEVGLGHDGSAGRRSLASDLAVLEGLRRMADDPAVRAVVVDLRNISAGWATLQQLRQALVHLRDCGKLVVTHLDAASTREVYLASAADRVWLTPSGEVFLQGVGAHMSFYGDALKRVGVVVELEAAGAYKSFGEPFTRAWPTRANREQTGELVGDLQEQLVSTIAAARGLSAEAVVGLMAESPLSAERALEAGLVDALAYPDQAHDRLEELLDGARRVSFRRYARWSRWSRRLAALGRGADQVAVVHLEGSIVQGAETSGGAGHRIDADRVVPVLDHLRRDPHVRAVVLYVNSPGGSALASDLIARAVRRIVEKKPVVALFGDVSASGGYYLSAPALELFAEAGTITGSIGVVGGKLALGPAAERFGVHHERIAAGPDSGLLNPWAPLTPDQRRRFRETLTRTYDRFLKVVSAGRKQPIEAIHAVAQGRVWTGQQALERGLVDHLGGLPDALRRVRVLAGIDPANDRVQHVRFAPPRYRVLQALLAGGVQARDLVSLALDSLGTAGRLARMVRDRPMQALLLLPYDIESS